METGIDGGLARRDEPGTPIMNFIDVPSVEECSRKIISNGGKIVQPRQAIPGVGYILVFQDTEGNVFGILETDTTAK